MNTSGTNDATPPTPPGTLDRFFAWLRGLGMVRGEDRWFAGVAGAIAAKANIDPIIVRGIFVVLAVLGGPGIVLYVAGWLLLPDRTDRIHLEDLFRGRASALTTTAAIVFAVLVVIPLIVWTLRSTFGAPFASGTWGLLPEWMQVTFGILFWAILLPAGIIWLIVWLSTRGSAQPKQGFAEQTTQFAEQTTQFAEAASNKAEEWTRKIDEKSHEWGEYGRENYQRYKPSAGFVAMTLALALLVGGITAAWSLTLAVDTNTTVIFGIVGALAVLAIAMIISGVRGRDSGWVGFFAFCGVIALAFAPLTGIVSGNTQVVPFGNFTLFEQDRGDDNAVFMVAGNLTVDLEQLSEQAQSRDIDVWLVAGNVKLWLPETAPTSVQIDLLAGNVRDQRAGADGERRGGIFVSRSYDHNVVTGAAADEPITVHVRLLAGNVTLLGDASTEGSRDVAAYRDRVESDRIERERQSEAERQREIESLRDRIEELENTR